MRQYFFWKEINLKIKMYQKDGEEFNLKFFVNLFK